MKCNHPIWSPVCSFHYNGECLREHNYECPALAMKNLSHGEMVQIAEERKDYVKVVRCKDCKFYSLNNGGGCTRCGGLEYLITADEYCSKGERKEKIDG